MIIRLFITAILFIGVPQFVQAQEAELEGYTPPPMFGAPRVEEPAYGGNKPVPKEKPKPIVVTPPPIEKTKSNIKVKPNKNVSKPIPKAVKSDSVSVKPKPQPKQKTKAKPAAIKKVKPKVPKKPKVVIPKKVPRVTPIVEVLQKAPDKKLVEKQVKEKKSDIAVKAQADIKVIPHPKNVFEGLPIEEVKEPAPTKVPTPIKKSLGLEPIDLMKKKPTSEGVVKGPKTMPAIKKQGVESEVLFAPETKKPANLLDRVQAKFKKKKAPEVLEKDTKLTPSANYEAPKFNVMADGNRKLNLLFNNDDMMLGNDNSYAMQELIMPLLQENASMRLRLESYASPQADSISGDKRVALSRVMSLRQYFIDNDIDASRLDIRSLGADTQSQPMDRIEIYLIN